MTHELSAGSERQPNAQASPQWLQLAQLTTPILVAIFGVGISVGNYFLDQNVKSVETQLRVSEEELKQANFKLDKLKTEFDQSKTISQEIRATINYLSEDSAKAKIALVSLYGLSEDEKYKALLVNVAIASGKEDLKTTIANLLGGENQQELDKMVKKYPALMSSKNKVLAQTGKETSTSVKQSGNFEEDRLPKTVNSNILRKFTAKNSKGWIFIGRKKCETCKFENVIVRDGKLPTKSSLITLADGVNLRVGKPQTGYSVDSLPNLTGALGKNSKVRIGEVAEVKSGKGNIGVWVLVEEIVEKF